MLAQSVNHVTLDTSPSPTKNYARSYTYYQDSAFFKVNVSAVALIHSRKYKCLVGTENVLSGVGDIFHYVAFIKMVFSAGTQELPRLIIGGVPAY